MNRSRAILWLGLTCLPCGSAALPARDAADPRVLAFERELLAGSSATLTLTRWCADHRLADPARIVAIRRRDADQPADAEVRRRLAAAPDAPLAYRRVELKCGDRVLSRADNWYRPDALTPDMNRALAATDTPFGKVVAPLGFHRVTLGAATPARPGDAILEVSAVLETPANRPFAFVRETYLAGLFAAR